MVQPLWKTVWRYLRKLNIELPYDPTILLLGIYPDKTSLGDKTVQLMRQKEWGPVYGTVRDKDRHLIPSPLGEKNVSLHFSRSVRVISERQQGVIA